MRLRSCLMWFVWIDCCSFHVLFSSFSQGVLVGVFGDFLDVRTCNFDLIRKDPFHCLSLLFIHPICGNDARSWGIVPLPC